MRIHTPAMLRPMLLNAIPTFYEDEIVTKSEILTYEDILTHCQNHAEHRRSISLVAATLKRSVGGRINILKDHKPDTSPSSTGDDAASGEVDEADIEVDESLFAGDDDVDFDDIDEED